MTELDVIKNNTELAKEFAQYLCVIKFNECNRANYLSAVSLARRASNYAQGPASVKLKKMVHVVAFNRTKAEAALAHSVIEELRTGGVPYTLMVDGRTQTNKYGFINALVCMNNAAACSDSKSHCYTTIADPFIEKPDHLVIQIFKDKDAKPPQLWRLPCRHLEGFIDYGPDPEANPKARLEAAAVRRCVIVCPFLELDKFEPINQIKNQPKYW